MKKRIAWKAIRHAATKFAEQYEHSFGTDPDPGSVLVFGYKSGFEAGRQAQRAVERSKKAAPKEGK